MKKYFLYLKKSLKWSIPTLVLIPFIHYLFVNSWYDWIWFAFAIPIFILLGGPLYVVARERLF
ncbi:hypothetical protein HO345_09080 [Treponema denticola]|uniref:hypothetical protein n=1 Tax=Treponema denticola TaxID=158 RepID=UPI0020A52838|nr:hypothetical protein [Treponema denticola]UTD13124.1 hypothetical protein HO345_09080 [Treponema denticola]